MSESWQDRAIQRAKATRPSGSTMTAAQLHLAARRAITRANLDAFLAANLPPRPMNLEGL